MYQRLSLLIFHSSYLVGLPVYSFYNIEKQFLILETAFFINCSNVQNVDSTGYVLQNTRKLYILVNGLK
ncbi:hypothetical protein LSPH24S_09040 [Lysinibacillus sphaericus]